MSRLTPETDSNEAWPATKYNLGNDSFVPAEFSRRLERERDEARNQRDILRLDAQKESEHHDRMIGELERVHAERDEAREKLRMASIEANARQEIANALKERDEYKQERDEAREKAAKWESSSEAMERAGADQARRTDENREWAVSAERERDEANKKANYQEYRIRYLESKLIKEINEANQDHLGWENKWKAAVEMAAIAENKVSNLENQLDLAMKTIKRLEAGLP